MKKVLNSALTNSIYYATVKELPNGNYVSTGNKEDITDDCIGAVFQWFVNEIKKDKAQTFEITYPISEYKLIMTKKENKENV